MIAARIVSILPVALLLGVVTTPAHAQGFPAKPIRYVMPTTGASELIGRVVAQGMSDVLGQQVYVDVRADIGKWRGVIRARGISLG
jgi:tripartite-type tricarboxylate transporter receptor subunit TctC